MAKLQLLLDQMNKNVAKYALIINRQVYDSIFGRKWLQAIYSHEAIYSFRVQRAKDQALHFGYCVNFDVYQILDLLS